MFGLTDIKKINERAAAKQAEGRHRVDNGHLVYRDAQLMCNAMLPESAREIADALNLADAFKEAQADAVGRT